MWNRIVNDSAIHPLSERLKDSLKQSYAVPKGNEILFEEMVTPSFETKFHPEESKITKKICSFKHIEENWDGNGALPISWETILNALGLFKGIVEILSRNGSNASIPHVNPLADGQIEFEWVGFNKELIFSVSGEDLEQVCFLKVEKTSQGGNRKRRCPS